MIAAKPFVERTFCSQCVNELFGLCAARGMAATAYCLMPDHAHLLLEGIEEHADLTGLMAEWKQRTGWLWKKRTGDHLWRKGYWNRLLRSHDAPLSVARYVVENPVRAGLVSRVEEYPWVGSGRYPLRQILEAVQMDVRWRRS